MARKKVKQTIGEKILEDAKNKIRGIIFDLADEARDTPMNDDDLGDIQGFIEAVCRYSDLL